MNRKRQRLYFLLAGMFMMAVAVTLVLGAFRDSLVFFITPTEWAEKTAAAQAREQRDGREFRLGGLVAQGSVEHMVNGTLHFTITDLVHGVPVTYRGPLPALFREGQGVVAQGRFTHGAFHARTILAKHDENYMPREVVEALKASGQWKEGR